jgi:hypothetical protein
MESGWVRRWVEVAVFVGIWIACGELLHMSPDIYLVFGIPLTAASSFLYADGPSRSSG